MVGQHGEAVAVEESVMAVVVGHKRVQAVLSHELEQHECERERVERGVMREGRWKGGGERETRRAWKRFTEGDDDPQCVKGGVRVWVDGCLQWNRHTHSLIYGTRG